MSLPRLLTVAGSDPIGGAGLQADLKTFAALGAWGASAVTAVTVQSTRGLARVEPLPGELVAEQIEAVLGDLGADAVKLGMLATADVARAVAGTLAAHGVGRGRIPLVVDPVLAAGRGGALLDAAGLAVLAGELLPRATLLTPNRPEAEALLGRPLPGPAEREAAALELAARGPAVLLKGGHAEGERVVDLLAQGSALRRFERPRLPGPTRHGTGCALAAACAVGLARGDDVERAVERALAWLAERYARPLRLGGGDLLLDHNGAADR